MNEKTMGSFLKQTRKIFGYTQEYVADKLHLVRQSYSHYETGRNTPTVNSIFNLAQLYRIPAEVFFSFITTYYSEEDYEGMNISGDIPSYIPLFVDRDELHDYMEFSDFYNSKRFRLRQEELIILYYARDIEESHAEVILHILKALKRARTDS